MLNKRNFLVIALLSLVSFYTIQLVLNDKKPTKRLEKIEVELTEPKSIASLTNQEKINSIDKQLNNGNNLVSKFEKENREKKNIERDEDRDEEYENEEAENEDAPEKAAQQDFERTKDPSLNRPTPEVLPGVILNSAIQSFSGALLGLPGAGASTSWVQRGPTNVGGRTRALAWDPNDGTGKKVWAGGVSGGLWYNNDITDPNSSWVNVGDVWSNLSITKISFDPLNSQIVYVSTGEGYQVNSTRGAGIWKSTNGGTSFTQLSSTTSMTFINDLVVRNEGGSSVIYAAVDGNYYEGEWSIFQGAGLYKSINGGNSWTQVLPNNSSTTTPYVASSISIGKDNRIWVGTKSSPYSGTNRGGGNIFYSDNGTSWVKAKSVAVTNGRGRVTVATANSDENYVYAFVEVNTTGGVSTISLIKSTDNGVTWSDMNLPDDVDNGISPSDFSRGQAWYDQVLNVDPNNPTTIYTGAIDLFKSTDAGATWTQISKWSNNPGMGSIARLSYVHADQHAMAFKPGSSSTAIFGNDGGVFYSADMTNASISSVINERNLNYNVTQFYAAAIHPSANTNYYLAGAQDNGTQQFNTAGLGSTNEVTGGDGAFCFIDQTNPNYQITSYVYNNIYRSTNGGNSFSTILDDDNSGSFINPACYDNNLHIFYSYKDNDGTNGVIKRITGINATPSVSDVTITGLNADVTAFKVSPITTGSTTLFIGTSNSKIIKVTNANGVATSTTISPNDFPAGASVSSIDIGANENELLVTFFNYGVDKIWYTANGGNTWVKKVGNFPNIPARWGMFNPDNRTNDVLLATELGIYGTTNFSNANPTWSQMNNGFTNVRTDMLQYRSSDKQVIAATHGRGLYSSNGFAVIPSILSYSPSTGSIGTTVTITGNDFDAITGVSFGGVAAASYTVTSLTSITAVVGAGASGNVAVTNSAGTGSLPGFTYCANATATLTSGVNSNNQTVCQNTAINSITYSTTNVTGVTITGVPSLTATYNANVVTITGTPASAGVYTFTVSFTGGCQTITATGTITVTAANTLTLTSAAGTNSQTLCINTPINNITYNTTGATGATFTSLPTGVTSTWSNNSITISGTPTVSGTFNYTISLTGGCGVITTTGRITVTPNNTITLNSATGTDSQTVCINTPITNIRYNTTGATNGAVANLPAGLIGTWANNVLTISGTPTVSGIFNYVVSTIGGCGPITSTGTINIQANNTIALSSGVGTNAQNVCINSAILATTYTTTGATGASVTGLPAGVTASWSANVVTISGTPTLAGNYTYTITTTGGCGVATITGTISVSQNAISLSSATGTDLQTVCSGTAITSITYTTTGATGATITGLPGGVTGSWSANTITISGTPTPTNGTFNYTITLTGGCGTVTKTGRIIVSFPNTITLSSAVGTNSQTVCINSAISSTTYNTTDATGATITGLPSGLSYAWSNNVLTISGAPTVSGNYSYTATTTGGCGVASTTGTYSVTPANTITLSSSAGTNSQTICINTAIASITYTTTGAINAFASGLPNGVTGTWSANVYTITGTPTVSGTYTYTVTTLGGCGVASITGRIIVNRNTITLSSAAGTDSQTICTNAPINNIVYATTIATGATITGLPQGMTGNWANNVYTIAGSSSVIGTYTYTITLTGGCDVVTKTGSIKVTNASIIGSITASSTEICPSNSTNFTLSNFNGTIVWQQSINGTNWSDVTTGTGINSTTYTTEALTSDRYFRAKATNGYCNAAYSNELAVVLLPTPTAPSISNANITRFCNGDSVKITSTLSNGLVWYKNDVLIPDQSTNIYYANTTGAYSAQVFALGCPSAKSNVLQIERVDIPTSPIVSDISLCQDAVPVTLNAIGSLGNTVLWYGTNATSGTSSTTAPKISTATVGTTNYYVSQRSALGCESVRAKITSKISANPAAPLITRNSQNNLVSSYSFGNTWYRDQTKLNDTSNIIKPLEQGNYIAKVVVNNCPSSYSIPYFYLNTVTDLLNLNQNEFIKIYPNPIQNDLKINYALTKYQKINVTIYSSTSGGKVIDLLNKESGMTIDVSSLSAGTYIVIISSSDNKVLYTQKVMKL